MDTEQACDKVSSRAIIKWILENIQQLSEETI